MKTTTDYLAEHGPNKAGLFQSDHWNVRFTILNNSPLWGIEPRHSGALRLLNDLASFETDAHRGDPYWIDACSRRWEKLLVMFDYQTPPDYWTIETQQPEQEQ